MNWFVFIAAAEGLCQSCGGLCTETNWCHAECHEAHIPSDASVPEALVSCVLVLVGSCVGCAV